MSFLSTLSPLCRPALAAVTAVGLLATAPAALAGPGDALEARSGARIQNTLSYGIGQVATQMRTVAESRGMVVDADMLIAGGQGFTIGHAANVDAEDLRREELYAGASLGLTYLALPADAGIPAGFYEVVAQLVRNPDGTERGFAMLLDRAGTIVAEMEADVFMDGDYDGTPARIKLDLSFSPGSAGVSIHGKNWEVTIEVSW